MDVLKKVYPHAFKANEIKDLIVALVIYILVDFVCGLVIGLLAKIPFLGIIFSLIGSVIGIYALIGIILSVLVFVKVVK